jgi:ATPase family AAA domain-containing protein 3A/B
MEKIKFIYKHPRSLVYGKKLIRMEGVDMEVIKGIANDTEGFSGREIQKMVVAWHDAAFTLPEPVLTPEIMRKILDKFHL